MKKFLIKTTRYLIIALILINLISWGSLYFLRNSSFYKPEFFTHEVKDKSFDYIVIGSSVGLTSVNTKLIDSLDHVKGINLSIDDTSTSSNYLMLEHFYNQGGKTKYCILSLSYWDLAITDPVLNDNDYRFLPFISENYVYNYYDQLENGIFKPLTYSRYLPFFGMSYYNTELFFPSLVAAIQPNRHNRFDESGNYFYPATGEVIKKEPQEITFIWNNPFLPKIQALCQANGTQLVIYQAPILQTKLVNTNNKYQLINHSTLLKPADGFYDELHVDVNGRKIASTALAKELKVSCFKDESITLKSRP
ncbi:MAG: hypothetical protein JST78_04480 [Bacteroidetes bacterium]|nr:hypothetical protein [Bacteroidota bacterium]